MRVADHGIELLLPEWVNTNLLLPSFKDFIIPDLGDFDPIIRVELINKQSNIDLTDAQLRSDISVTWGDRFRFFETADRYVTQVIGDCEAEQWDMISTKDFKTSTIYVASDTLEPNGILTWMLMVAFGQSSLLHQTLLIHASVIEKEGVGYAFLGKSGTGKSTHARLWLKHIENSELLNDDNPAIRIFDDGFVYIYGTPWSGKTPCYKNRRTKLGGIVRLQQAPQNEITIKKGSEALITVLPSGSGLRWNSILFDTMLTNLELIIAKVPIAYLKCLPNKEAALLSYNTINKQTIK